MSLLLAMTEGHRTQTNKRILVKSIIFESFSANTSEKVPFLLVRFLWASKENEHIKQHNINFN